MFYNRLLPQSVYPTVSTQYYHGPTATGLVNLGLVADTTVTVNNGKSHIPVIAVQSMSPLEAFSLLTVTTYVTSVWAFSMET